jgi:hypothetical protein
MFEIRERFDFQAALSKVVASDNPVRFGAAARTSDLSETSSCGTTDGGDALTAESKCPGQVRTGNNVKGPPVRIVHQERGAFDILNPIVNWNGVKQFDVRQPRCQTTSLPTATITVGAGAGPPLAGRHALGATPAFLRNASNRSLR